ncbi:MAG: hypothetical protein DRJ68_04015 [Thermoprotei archaeon]|nr:MAG: hypothetical protein DRJ68_04015 [Thermoprotei archaeon]
MSYGNLTLYKVELQLLTPTILSERVGKAGYSTLSRAIPGSTLRGAILSMLYREGINVQQESTSPTIAFSPAAPEGGVMAHAFTVECKLTRRRDDIGDVKEVFSLLRSMGIDVQSNPEILASSSELERKYKEFMLKLEQEEHGLSALLKDASGSYFKETPDGWTEVKPPVETQVNVSISKTREAAEAERLWSYDAVSPGAKYKALIADLRGNLMKWLSKLGLDSKFEIGLGRGVSRGFGRACVKLSTVDLSSMISSMKSLLLKQLEKGYAVLQALSPVASTTLGGMGLSSVPSLAPSDTLTVPSSWIVSAITSLKAAFKLKTVAVYGKTMLVKGYSSRSRRPRPWITALAPGSIMVLKPSEESMKSRENLAEMLALSCLCGFNELSCIGLNFASPFEDKFPAWRREHDV